jgi:peroxiredoxin
MRRYEVARSNDLDGYQGRGIVLKTIARRTTGAGSKRSLATALLVVWVIAFAVRLGAAETPRVGSKAPDFTLSTPEGKAVHLSALLHKGNVVLIVLRGYPGYQCPYCQKQAHDFQVNAGKFAAVGAQLLLVYPGPSAELDKRAKEFLAGSGGLPGNFNLVIDPDYKFTNQYGLRWDASEETAYPSTFLINRKGVVFFRKVSHEHGDRTTAADVLEELSKSK